MLTKGSLVTEVFFRLNPYLASTYFRITSFIEMIEHTYFKITDFVEIAEHPYFKLRSLIEI